MHDLRADPLEPLHHAILLGLAQLGVRDPVGQVDALGRHGGEADHAPGQPRDRADVAAHPGRVLAVEDDLGGHRAQDVDQAPEHLRAPVGEALLDLHRPVVAAGGPALADRQARRHQVLVVEVRAHRVAGLVDRGRALLVRRVLLADGHARLDGRHRLDDVLPRERRAAVGVGVGQRQRAHLVDHRRGVAGRDARELVALLLRVEVRVVGDLRDVEVEDVAPVLPRGRAEVDVPAHPARARERGVERLERHVARADEVDLLLARLRAASCAAAPARRAGARCRAHPGTC